MIKFSALSLAALSLLVTGQSLEFKPAVNEVTAYKVSLSGMGETSSVIKVKAQSIDDKGNVKLHFAGATDGDGGSGSINDSMIVSKYGAPSQFPIQGAGLLISAFNIVNTRPAGELKEAQEFKIEVHNEAVDINLTGKVTSIKVVDGKTHLTVSEEGSIDPKMGASNAKIESTFELETGQLVRSTSSVEIPGAATMTFNVSRKESKS